MTNLIKKSLRCGEKLFQFGESYIYIATSQHFSVQKRKEKKGKDSMEQPGGVLECSKTDIGFCKILH